MKAKKIVATLLALGGIALILTSHYINVRVAEGQQKVDRAQRQVDAPTGGLFNRTPMGKEVERNLKAPAQERIDAGREEISEYTSIAYWIRIGGMALLILGMGLFFIRKKK